MKRYATAQRQEAPRLRGERALQRQGGSRRAGPDLRVSLPNENQIVRGLIVGLPLAIALWIVLALLVWMTF
ncbi:MAG: hypothetical protein JWL91_888, partial [Sphingomonas bacterium]